jgi:hypothetical protein
MIEFISIVALIISSVALAITYWQTKLVRQSIESQTFTILLERAREIEMSSTLDFLGTVEFSDYSTFQNSVPPEQQAQIRAVVDFYNDLSHMMRNRYIDDFYPIRVYHPGLLLCARKLLPWWLDGIRATRYSLLYDSFKWLCQYAVFLEGEMKQRNLPDIPKIRYRKYINSRRLEHHQ